MGQIINTLDIENYPGISHISGFDFATNLYQQVKDLGVEIKIESVHHIDDSMMVTRNRGSYQGKSIILATGVSNRTLNLDNEKEFIGKGISYCATCDGPFIRIKMLRL